MTTNLHTKIITLIGKLINTTALTDSILYGENQQRLQVLFSDIDHGSITITCDSKDRILLNDIILQTYTDPLYLTHIVYDDITYKGSFDPWYIVLVNDSIFKVKATFNVLPENPLYIKDFITD